MKIVIDLDDTLTIADSQKSYQEVLPREDVIDTLREYKKRGFEIVIATARNMRTYSGHVGKINANTLPIILEWLEKHNVPYDEIIVGKPSAIPDQDLLYYTDYTDVDCVNIDNDDTKDIDQVMSLRKKDDGGYEGPA